MVTTTLTLPALPEAGVVQVIWVVELVGLVGQLPFKPPKVTVVFPAPTIKLVPWMVTVVPPALAPDEGEMEEAPLLIVGAFRYVNWLAAVTVPPRVVITRLTAPAAWLGVVQESCVSETTVQVLLEPPKVAVWFVLR